MPLRFKVHNSLIDKSFTTDNAAGYYLCLLAGEQHFSYAVFHPGRKKYIALESFSYDHSKSDRYAALNVLLGDKPWLRQPFAQVFFIVDNPLSTLIPPPLFQEEEALMYLKFNHPVTDDYTALFNHLKTANIMTVFGISKNISDLTASTWDNIRYFHQTSVIIESLLINYKNKAGDLTLFLNVRDGGFDLVYFKNNKLYFYNFFRYNTKEDFIYFLLTALEELQLNPEKVRLMLSGAIDKNSILYEMVYRYIRISQFVERNEVFGYSYLMDDLMGHKHYTLFNVQQCV